MTWIVPGWVAFNAVTPPFGQTPRQAASQIRMSRRRPASRKFWRRTDLSDSLRLRPKPPSSFVLHLRQTMRTMRHGVAREAGGLGIGGIWGSWRGLIIRPAWVMLAPETHSQNHKGGSTMTGLVD